MINSSFGTVLSAVQQQLNAVSSGEDPDMSSLTQAVDALASQAFSGMSKPAQAVALAEAYDFVTTHMRLAEVIACDRAGYYGQVGQFVSSEVARMNALRATLERMQAVCCYGRGY